MKVAKQAANDLLVSEDSDTLSKHEKTRFIEYLLVSSG